MTQDAQGNLKYVQDSLLYVGFDTLYHQAVKEGIEAGDKEISLKTSRMLYGGDQLFLQPKVTEMDTRPGFYNLNGFRATLLREGETEPITQFFPNFKMAGMTIDQAHAALEGGTVLVSEYNNKAGEKRFAFMKLDMSQPVGLDENYPVIRMAQNDIDFARLLSKAQIVGSQANKEKYTRLLQAGERFQVKVAEPVQNGSVKYPLVFLHLDLMDPTTLAIRVTNADGLEIRPPHTVEKNSVQSNLKLTDTENMEIPPSVRKMMENTNQPRIGGHGLSRA